MFSPVDQSTISLMEISVLPKMLQRGNVRVVKQVSKSIEVRNEDAGRDRSKAKARARRAIVQAICVGSTAISKPVE
jgi:hypothetical protein